jgi:riboflavin synthase
MFTGIVEEIGMMKAIQKGGDWCKLTIRASSILEDVKLGDSIAVNGVCLTVTHFTKDQFIVDVMPDTMTKTSLAALKTGSQVNLERAMAADGRFGGHFVSGHVDGTGIILSRKPYGNAVLFDIGAPKELLNYMIPKGSIAVDGISLTIVVVGTQSFQLSIIPHTLEQTVLALKQAGDIVNLECDMVGKYIEKFVQNRQSKGQLTESFLAEHGFM